MGLQVGRALRIVSQTMPYVMYRAGIYGAACLGGVVYLGLLGIVGLVFSAGAFWLLLALSLGLVGVLGWGRLIRMYFSYLIEAGHVALITEIVAQDQAPRAISQPEWAKDRVTRYFRDANVLALIDQFVKGIVRTINRRLVDVSMVVPIPASKGAVNLVVDYSLGYMDDVVLAHAFKTQNENVFDAAKEAIVLYCQLWKDLLKDAVAVAVLGIGFAIVAAVLWMVPLGIVASILPETWGTMKLALFLMAVLLGISTKWILFDPVARASTLLAFLEASDQVTPNADWQARLESESDAFRELKRKAEEVAEDMKRRDAGASAS